MKNDKKIILSKILGLTIIVVTMLFFVRVTVKASYEEPDSEFRAVWVTPWGGDSALVSYTSEVKFKANMNYILNLMEEYNMNVMIYHIRTHNNALYNSDINPLSSYWSSVNFSVFDPLTWLIDECHLRGIEFHAWLNPYRVSSSYSGTVEEFAATVQSNNVASDASNLLKTTGGVILNPAKAVVRDFIIQTVAEIVNRYNVDAIHFDDYFYADMGANGATSGTKTIINEPDQSDYEAYINNNPTSGYVKTSATNKADWRRAQVDLMILGLSTYIKAYNETNTRYVQLGIAPTGIYKNGNGIVTYNASGEAVTTGSNTRGQTHYSSYLFCDTLKWCNEGWIDYILPQSYWGMTHPIAGYQEVMGWWNKVVKNLDVNLYSGIGLYMADESGNTHSWQSDNDELLKQLTYLTTLEHAQGASIYNFNNLRKNHDGKTTQAAIQVANLGVNCWTKKVLLPEIKSMTPVNLGKVTNLEVTKEVNGNKIVFDAVDNAKFYIIYRGTTPMTFATNQLYEILGPKAKAGKIEYLDENASETQCVYGVKVMSGTNTLGDGADYGMLDFSITFTDEAGNFISTVRTPYGEEADAPLAPTKPGATFIGWSRDISDIKGDLTVSAKYSDSKFTVIFYGINNKVLKTEGVFFNEAATAPIPEQEGYTFVGWSNPFSNVIYDLDIFASYEINIYKVIFNDFDGNFLTEVDVEYLQDALAPTVPVRKGYTFSGWDQEITAIKGDITIVALYEKDKFTVTFVNDFDNSVILVKEVEYGDSLTYPEPPVVRGYNFSRWNAQDVIVLSDRTIYAKYNIGEYKVSFVDWDGTLLKEVNILFEEEVIAPSNPLRDNHDFSGWDQEFVDVAEDMVITALYTLHTYTVNFFGPNKELLHVAVVGHNNSANGFEANVEGYKFISWDTDYSQVTENLNIYGTWEEVKVGCNSLNYINGLSMLSLGLVLFILRKRFFI